MSRLRIRDVWSAAWKISSQSGEQTWFSRTTSCTNLKSCKNATSALWNYYSAMGHDALVRQRGLAILIDRDRGISGKYKEIDDNCGDFLADWRGNNVSSFKYPCFGASNRDSDQLYRPSGLNMLVNSTSAMADNEYNWCEEQRGVRGFAKTVQVPQLMQKPMKLKFYMSSPGVIGEPYKPPPPPLPILKRWFTREGWARRKQKFMGMVKTSYTIAKLRQKTKGYSQQRFYQEASDLYKQVNVALAEGERTTLRHIVTDSVFTIMKNELKHRESSTWAKVKWEMVGPPIKLRTLQGRLIGVDKNNHDNAFVQLTVRITSKQKFAAYDKRGKLVAGDPEKELLVEDIWVFEKPLLQTEAKWRLGARLSV